jgi:hypothetical protein
MIISASYKTDIPAFYGRWFLERLRAGYCEVANPYNGRPFRVSLRREDVDGFVFWTKNLQPFSGVLAEVRERGFPFVVQYTVNGYPRELERSVADWRRAVEHLRRLAGEFGPRAGVWRYDTILMTALTPPEWHLANFQTISRELEDVVDEVVVSFAHFYRKTRRNLTMAACAQGFEWTDPPVEDKRRLLETLGAIAGAHGQRVTVCAQPEMGGEPARCIDAERLSAVAGYPVRARTKGNRPGCECAESRDIGAYETCPHGCVYCYAVDAAARARRNWARHDPAAGLLGAPRASLE